MSKDEMLHWLSKTVKNVVEEILCFSMYLEKANEGREMGEERYKY